VHSPTLTRLKLIFPHDGMDTRKCDGDHESCVSCPGGGGGAKTASAKKGGLFTDFFPFLRFIGFIFSMTYTAKHFRVEFGTFKSLNIKGKQEKLYLLFLFHKCVESSIH
jgi:hypothetical protein